MLLRAGLSGFFRRQCSSKLANLTKDEVLAASVDKQLLLKLRKRTGYGFNNCKKALVLFPDSLDEAESYLHKLAQEEGWNRAEKLQGRKAREGLIGVMAAGTNNWGVMVEVNCETDFVSRNAHFRSLVCAAAHCVLSKEGQEDTYHHDQNEMTIDLDKLKQSIIPVYEVANKEYEPPVTEPLENYLNFLVAKLGEKLEITRASLLVFPEEEEQHTLVWGYAHPRMEEEFPGGVKMGDYGTLIGLTRFENYVDIPGRVPLRFLSQQLGQHIIGMSPTSVGTMPTKEELDEEASKKKAEEGEEKSKKEKEEEVTKFEMDEKRLLRQSFLINPDITVGNYLRANGVMVDNFLRFHAGETHVAKE